MKGYFKLLALFIIVFLFSTCTKDVNIDFPNVESKLVVDGAIYLNQPPVLFLTKTQSFNAPLDPSSLENLFERDAQVKVLAIVGSDTTSHQLQEICADQLSEEQLELAAELLGIEPFDLSAISYCVYTDLSGELRGEVETDYHLQVLTEGGETLRAETRINTPIPLDSVWFELWASNDSLGFLYAELSDPPLQRNAYRWRAQRINSYANGQQKDFGMIAPLGSSFEDRFFDGLSFEFVYNRGNIPNSPAEDDNNEEDGFYKVQDTVVVEFSSTTLAVYDYYTASDDQLVNNGSPFAVPANLPSNIEGGLGLWAGYAQAYDTLVCIP